MCGAVAASFDTHRVTRKGSPTPICEANAVAAVCTARPNGPRPASRSPCLAPETGARAPTPDLRAAVVGLAWFMFRTGATLPLAGGMHAGSGTAVGCEPPRTARAAGAAAGAAIAFGS